MRLPLKLVRTWSARRDIDEAAAFIAHESSIETAVRWIDKLDEF
jgi:plasmid stabilization system protein ParE